MNVEARKSLAIYLAEHSARYRGVAIPDDERGGELAMLVKRRLHAGARRLPVHGDRRAILAEKDKLPKR